MRMITLKTNLRNGIRGPPSSRFTCYRSQVGFLSREIQGLKQLDTLINTMGSAQDLCLIER